MKKILLFLGAFVFMVGCNNLMNTPTKKVEEFLNKYQTMDSEVMNQLNYTLDENYTLTENQKEDYKTVMKKQYKDLIYTIKEETVDGDTSTVKVEIEVYDYSKAIEIADNYLINNQNEFINEDGSVNSEKFMDYKIDEIEKQTDRVKYTLELTLTKQADTWKMDDITEIDRQKIHGIYSY